MVKATNRVNGAVPGPTVEVPATSSKPTDAIRPVTNPDMLHALNVLSGEVVHYRNTGLGAEFLRSAAHRVLDLL